MSKNLGFDPKKQKLDEDPIKDWVFGATPLSGIAENINYRDYLPKGEVQRGAEDFMDCATRGPMNILETKFTYAVKEKKISAENIKWLKDKGYADQEGNVTFSDRFNAVLSGTSRQGNSLKAPIESIRVDGLIPKYLLPKSEAMTWNEYHDKTKITQSLRDLGQEFKKRFTINYEAVPISRFGEVQKYDMIDIAVYAWPNPIGMVYPRVEYQFNHVVAKFDDFSHYIFDNYVDVDEDFIKQLASDYNIYPSGYRIIINEIPQKKSEEEGDTMTFYQEAGSPKIYQRGADGLYHWIPDQPTFKALYGDFSQHKIEKLGKLNPEFIGFTIYNKVSFLTTLTELLKTLGGRK